jgi:hypothetical protein
MKRVRRALALLLHVVLLQALALGGGMPCAPAFAAVHGGAGHGGAGHPATGSAAAPRDHEHAVARVAGPAGRPAGGTSDGRRRGDAAGRGRGVA